MNITIQTFKKSKLFSMIILQMFYIEDLIICIPSYKRENILLTNTLPLLKSFKNIIIFVESETEKLKYLDLKYDCIEKGGLYIVTTKF